MSDTFSELKELYTNSYALHGDSPSSILTPKGKNKLRFRALNPLISRKNITILDYGCGLGFLYSYLIENFPSVDYRGIDIVPEFVNACSNKFPNASFKCINEHDKINNKYDIVFASGVFNLKTNTDSKVSKSYAFNRVKNLFNATSEVFICDFLSSFVDYEQQNAQHFSVDEVSSFCAHNLSRRFQIRHDLLPYEFTLIAWKDSQITIPDNCYQVDS